MKNTVFFVHVAYKSSMLDAPILAGGMDYFHNVKEISFKQYIIN